jgi:hypothetical protein
VGTPAPIQSLLLEDLGDLPVHYPSPSSAVTVPILQVGMKDRLVQYGAAPEQVGGRFAQFMFF